MRTAHHLALKLHVPDPLLYTGGAEHLYSHAQGKEGITLIAILSEISELTILLALNPFASNTLVTR